VKFKIKKEDEHLFYEVDGNLYFIDKDTDDVFKLDINDFDKEELQEVPEHTEEKENDNIETLEDEEVEIVGEEDLITKTSTEEVDETAIKNEIEGESDMDFEMRETSETKPDGSTAMYERRVSQCMEESGKSREECLKEVKKKMKEKGSENAISGADLKEKEEKPEDKEEKEEKKPDEEEEKEKDTIEVCKEEYDFLKEQSEKMKALESEKTEVEKKLDAFKEDFLKVKKKIEDKEALEKETHRQEKIESISVDFNISFPKDEFKDDSIEELEKFYGRLDMILNREQRIEEEAEITEEDNIETMTEKMKKRYFVPL